VSKAIDQYWVDFALKIDANCRQGEIESWDVHYGSVMHRELWSAVNNGRRAINALRRILDVHVPNTDDDGNTWCAYCGSLTEGEHWDDIKWPCRTVRQLSDPEITPLVPPVSFITPLPDLEL
jgi:hypothetical protein